MEPAYQPTLPITQEAASVLAARIVGGQSQLFPVLWEQPRRRQSAEQPTKRHKRNGAPSQMVQSLLRPSLVLPFETVVPDLRHPEDAALLVELLPGVPSLGTVLEDILQIGAPPELVEDNDP